MNKSFLVLFFKKGRLAFGWPALLLLSACQTAPQPACRLALAAELPVSPDRGHVALTAILNGTATRMWVDTGAEATTITNDAASRLQLTLDPIAIPAFGVGGATRQYRFTARRFELGRLFGEHLKLRVINTSMPVDGLLGDDFLSAYDVDLDLPERKLILYTPSRECTAPVAALRGPLHVVGMSRPNRLLGLQPRIEVRIGGHALSAVVDSGSPSTLLFLNGAILSGLKPADLVHDPHLHATGVGPFAPMAARHVMAPIRIGDMILTNVPATIVGQTMPGTDMLLGLDFLARVHVWFSFHSRTLIMQYPPGPSLHPPRN